jgi:hypothetical protein
MVPERRIEDEMTIEKEKEDAALNEARKKSSERISQAIRDLPDYTKVDDSGFLRDMVVAFKDDTKKIWRERKVRPTRTPQP